MTNLLEKYPKMLAGDSVAVEQLRKLVLDYGVKTIVETGTWHGDSTFGFAEIAPTVITVEINKVHYDMTLQRAIAEGYEAIPRPHYMLCTDGEIHCYSNGLTEVSMILGNSPDIILSTINYLYEPVLFFLDAHWYNPNPLRDEIRAIRTRPNSLIVIHDILVPEHPELGFDPIPNSKMPISLDWIRDDLVLVNPKYKMLFNSAATGGKVGILYVVPPSAMR